MTSIKGAIFDVDGTLLDSMQIWENMAAYYLESRNISPHPGLNNDLLALGGHEIPAYFQDEYGLKESVEQIKNGMNKLLEEFYLHKAPVKKGVLSVLDALHERGVKMCVATATDRWLIEPALRRCGLLKYFGRIFTCGEESTSKSSPDIYLRAAAFLETEVSDTLVFEDALYAIKSAKGAGFPVIALYDLAAEHKTDAIKKICDHYFICMDEILEIL
jgi:HAD superfamily hydrolase (TIGR01509 family)